MKNVIGFWGYIEPNIVNKYKKLYPNAIWLDLDIDYNFPDLRILPEAYCRIIKNIINNTIAKKDELLIILAPIGKDKCDSGWFAFELLKDMGFNIISTKFEKTSPHSELFISTSNLPLIEKINLITKNIIEQKDYSNLQKSKPQFGFWGVPPNDMEILKIFPNNTHVFGWTRCVEANTPADIELEMFVEKDLPCIFYAQSFCAKAQLAKYLADKYNGLFVDIDDNSTNSVKAKIEAFLRLR